MAQYTFSDFIHNQIAPPNARMIGIYDSNNQKVGEIPLGTLENNLGTPIYRVGLLSDIHVDTTDYNYSQYLNSYPYSDEGAGDLRRALAWLRDVEHVDMICACGDLSQYGNDSEFTMTQTEVAQQIPNIPFYTCTGNHDVSGHTGAPTFPTYTRRTLDTTAHTLVTSTAYTNSFYFLHNYTVGGETKSDVFAFLSMNTSTCNSGYLDSDITWLGTVLEQYKTSRVFIFTHLFFPDYAGNLGRVNGTGGIYPTGNWMAGSNLTNMTRLLSTYNNTFWFSGHSHWKWDLQRFQKNANVARYGNSGAWTIHLPSCALPIDSDYTNITQQTDNNRVEKPLESQGAVMDVYADKIVIRGIDFNINASQNSSTTQGYEGSDYVRYLPIAMYELHTGVNPEDGEDIEIGTWEQGGWGSTSGEDTEGTKCIRSPYIAVDTNHRYYLTTTNIADQTNPDNIRELSMGVYTGTLGNLTFLGRLTGHVGFNTTTSKIGGTSSSLNYLDRIYNNEDFTDYLFTQYPTAAYIRFKCYLMGAASDAEDRDISVSHGENVSVVEVLADVDPGEVYVSQYLTSINFTENSSKTGGVITPTSTLVADLGDTYKDYVCVTFSGTRQGFWVDSPTYDSSYGTSQTATVELADLKVYSGSYSSTILNQSTISLPTYVGFYSTGGYGISNGFVPSTTETNSEGRCQFQTSSSYTGGTITVLMKAKLNYTH